MAPKRKAATAEPVARLDHDVKARIDGELYRRLQEVARQEDRSESAIMRRALRHYLQEVA
jgi:predicted transcriptional regulator